jgi:DUF2075 family protein
MIVYSATKKDFVNDVLSNDIGNIIYNTYKSITGRSTSRSEFDSWTNSLQAVDRAINTPDIPDDAGIAIEYHIPRTSKRIDFIVTGLNLDKQNAAVLIELKQWQEAELTDLDGIVKTRFKHGVKQTAHPSYQVWSYKMLLENFNESVQTENVKLHPCAYLHNYNPDGVITNNFYKEYIDAAPLFLKSDALKLREFVAKNIRYGDKSKVLYILENGKLKPSKSLVDELKSMLFGNQEFVMIDDQKLIYETALSLSEKSKDKKNVLIVHGGPGTGKSVIAINLLVKLTENELITQYVTRNSAPREVYEAKLTGSFKKSHISNMFSGSGSFHSVEADSYDCLIVDEAHRLNAKSGMFSHLGENQIKEIIDAAKLSIFFVDEDQKVTLKDIGEAEEIKKWAEKCGAEVTEMQLESQFRCNGSDGYLAWLDNTLQIRQTANVDLVDAEYDFQVVDSPEKLHEIIRENNRNNKARVVAGYCWKWISKKHPELKDIVIGDYGATWNLDSHGQAWIIKDDSVSEVGCIHTCQGLEVDYVGVIIGPDLIVRDGKVVTRPEERASTDKSIHGWKKLMEENPEETHARLDAIIKNTYRTLMTRGQKGCYIFCTDKETQEYFQSFQ